MDTAAAVKPQLTMGAAVKRVHQAAILPDPILPPLYNPTTHSETGTPFARPWDAQDEANRLSRQAADDAHVRSIIIDKATELLSTRIALNVIN
jgi:hypothetical protein